MSVPAALQLPWQGLGRRTLWQGLRAPPGPAAVRRCTLGRDRRSLAGCGRDPGGGPVLLQRLQQSGRHTASVVEMALQLLQNLELREGGGLVGLSVQNHPVVWAHGGYARSDE